MILLRFFCVQFGLQHNVNDIIPIKYLLSLCLCFQARKQYIREYGKQTESTDVLDIVVDLENYLHDEQSTHEGLYKSCKVRFDLWLLPFDSILLRECCKTIPVPNHCAKVVKFSFFCLL